MFFTILCFLFIATVFINTNHSPLPSLTSASGMDGFCPDKKTTRVVLTWACRCWRHRGRQLGALTVVNPTCCSRWSWGAIAEEIFLTIAALEDDDDGDGGLA